MLSFAENFPSTLYKIQHFDRCDMRLTRCLTPSKILLRESKIVNQKVQLRKANLFSTNNEPEPNGN